MTTPVPHIVPEPKTPAQHSAEARLQRKIAKSCYPVRAKGQPSLLHIAALDRAAYHERMARTLRENYGRQSNGL